MPSRPSNRPAPPDNRSLLIRFLLVLLASAFCALGFTSMTGRVGQLAGVAVAVNLAGAAGIGLTAGFFTRVLLRTRRVFLRGLTSVTGVLWGLLVFGYMTGWQYGIGPLYFFRATIDWLGLGLISLGGFFALTANLAYREQTRAQAAVNRSVASARSMPRQSTSSTKTVAVQPRRNTTVSTAAGKRPARQKNKSADLRVSKGLAKKKKEAGSIQPKARSKPATLKRRPSKKIVLATAEEHRCPYCLELVKPNDPRGVVECSICHTLHHADCWAITGTCQVPHYNQ